MSLRAAAALTGGPRSGAALVLTSGFRFLVASYTLLGAVACAYLFAVSTQPVTIPDDPPVLGPPWVGGAVFVLMFALAAPWALLPVPLLIVGALRLRQVPPAGWRWCAAWVAAIAASTGLEVLAGTHYAQPWVSPAYQGAAVVNWMSLAESAGFVCAGVAMMTVLTAAQRSVNRQLAGTRPAGPQVGQSQNAPSGQLTRRRINKLSIAALACGISGILGWFGGTAAVVLGLIARRKVHASGARGGLAALTGLSLGYVAAVDTLASEIIRWL